MNLSSLFGFAFVILFIVLLLVFAIAGRNRPRRNLREIPAFLRLRRAVGLSVEAGTRLHVSLGRGGMTGEEGAPAFAGLTMLERITRAASISDRPPVSTAGDGSLAILERDTMKASFRALGAENQYNPNSGQLVGITPFSYAAGAMPVAEEEQVSTSVLVGHFGDEVALITDAAEKSNALVIGGTDNLPGQSILYASTDEPLIGEEVFAGGAYLGAGPTHDASLRVEDIFRWVLIAAMLVGGALVFMGMDKVISDVLGGILP